MKNARRIPISEETPESVVVSGNGHAPPDEMISESELAILKGLKAEVESLKRRQNALQKDLTLVSADFYRKNDELEVRALDIAKKYNLVKGERELEIATGRILKMKGKS